VPAVVALFELVKPAITRLVLITMVCGALVAPGSVAWQNLAWAILATALVVGAANALNMVLERDIDALMTRTQNRPIPSGRISAKRATVFGVGLAGVGLAVAFAVSPLVGALNLVALVTYVLVYTPLKRVTPLALHVGAVPGAMPPLIGWASTTGSLSWEALIPFLILFVWQLPHFLAISVFRRAEYERAGIRVLSVTKGLERTKLEILIYSVLLLATTLLPLFAGVGLTYSVIAVATGLGFVGMAFLGSGVTQQLQRGLSREANAIRDEAWARRLFFASLPHLVILYATLVIVTSLA
jgi:protoheme IX farnesyltransferase